ncbi:MAG: replicative DNA helicase [Sedimentisphaerales bacterium]|nr:replicative DNA helicase [Sedimentisphaerales bacterium]
MSADKKTTRAISRSSASARPTEQLALTKSMPESVAAEAAVLGSMLIDPACIGQVIEVLNRDCFYRPEHQIIFDALVDLYQRHKAEAIDGVLLRDELERRGQMEAVGGVEYLAKVVDSVPSSANVMYYAGIVHDKALLRELIAVSAQTMQQAYEQSSDVAEILDLATQRLFAVSEKKVSSTAASLKDLVTAVYELIEKREGTHVTGLPTGFHQLDDMTCGLQPGEMVVIAGRPSMGKTALALNIAEHLGVVEKRPIAIFSLEMSKQVLAERFLCSVSGVDGQLVRKGILSTEHYRRLVEACGVLAEAPIFIDDASSLTPLELRAKARRLRNLYGIQCVMVDYLQLMHLGQPNVESRQQEISTISRYLKGLARELNIPVVVLSQLNRAPEGREGHRPRMSDLRESGSIEQDADLIILLHREDYYRKGEPDYEQTNTAELIIAKQRNGPTGTVKLIFREQCTRFENLAFVSDSTEEY